MNRCFRCKRELNNRFGFACNDCFKAYEPEKYARKIAYDTYGTAERCEECGSTYKVEWHHPDYSKPLKVIPLCKTCHGKKR